MAFDHLSAAHILAIPAGSPERLFSGERSDLHREFAALVKRWHPDRNGVPGAADVFERVVALHKEAERKLEAGLWGEPDMLRIDTVEGDSLRLAIKRRHEFELGEMAIAAGSVVFLVDKEHESLFRQGLRRIAGIRYPDAKVRRDLERFLPSLERACETVERHVAIFGKAEDVVLLRDLLDYIGGQLPPKHAAWIVSSLLNLACFFEVSDLTHNALSAETVFVAPQHHAAYPLGGWWYATERGSRLELLPPTTHDLLPPSMAASKRADIRLDLESIRAIGRTCLGDPTGVSLVGRKDVPQPIADFLRLPSSGSALEDYRAWMKHALPGFGPRRFLELPITSSDVYP